MENLKVRDVIEKLNIHSSNVLGDLNKTLGSAATLTNIINNQFTFCKEKNANMLDDTHNCVIVVPKLGMPILPSNTYILVDNPRLVFLRIMKLVYPDGTPPKIVKGINVVIDESTVVGTQGYGYERNDKGELEHFMCIGGVRIGDNVTIGSNTSIDRGTIDDTIIGEGTKIDNLVHVAHNVIIGKHCEIIAHAMLGGSCVIGDYTRIAPGA